MNLNSVYGCWSVVLCLTCSDAADTQIEERRALGQNIPPISRFLFMLLHSFVSVITSVSLRSQSGSYSTNPSTIGHRNQVTQPQQALVMRNSIEREVSMGEN